MDPEAFVIDLSDSDIESESKDLELALALDKSLQEFEDKTLGAPSVVVHQCAICLLDMLPHQKKSMLKCMRTYHSGCLANCRRPTCPIDREEFFSLKLLNSSKVFLKRNFYFDGSSRLIVKNQTPSLFGRCKPKHHQSGDSTTLP